MHVNTLPTVFKSVDFKIRSILRDGDPWFVGADICAALELTNPGMVMKALDSDERDIHPVITSGGTQKMTVVSESGMYTLVLRCRDAVKPGTAQHRFRKWVTSEVLPAIRRSGAYATNASEPDIPLLINAGQQTDLERAVHDLAIYAGARGANYRSTCHKAWREIRNRFGLTEYVQLPSNRFQEALDLVFDLRAEWEAQEATDGCYTLDHFLSMMHGYYLENRVPSRVEVELGRKWLMRTKDALIAARAQLKPAAAPAEVRAAKRLLSDRALSFKPDPYIRSLNFRSEVA